LVYLVTSWTLLTSTLCCRMGGWRWDFELICTTKVTNLRLLNVRRLLFCLAGFPVMSNCHTVESHLDFFYIGKDISLSNDYHGQVDRSTSPAVQAPKVLRGNDPKYKSIQSSSWFMCQHHTILSVMPFTVTSSVTMLGTVCPQIQ
jgi:hypothetical protein